MKEKMLQLIADGIDGKLFFYDDGYVIEVLTGKEKILFTYDEGGNLEKTEVKK